MPVAKGVRIVCMVPLQLPLEHVAVIVTSLSAVIVIPPAKALLVVVSGDTAPELAVREIVSEFSKSVPNVPVNVNVAI